MTSTILVTKLFIPPTRLELVTRPRLIEKLNEGVRSGRKLTLISAPAGFGKTTLVSEWVDNLRLDTPQENQFATGVAWLSLDEGDNDTTRFLTYFIAALNHIEGIEAAFGKGALSILQSPQPPPVETILTSLINELTDLSTRIIFVLDDYHLIETQPIHDALSFLLEHQPPQMHLVIATREDLHMHLSRLRVRDQLTELRARDLRFTSAEAAEFLNQVMALDLSTEDITALETRTEGWIAGLQLAALALQWTISIKGQEAPVEFIKSFTGSHRLVMDYLIEEVLNQQAESVQTFLLQTSILDRLTGSLCDAVRFGKTKSSRSSDRTALTGHEDSQAILEMLDRANLFIVPLDNERKWYRYHHLFTDLLRQRLHQGQPDIVDELHIRASGWYENNGLAIEAFQHAAAANDVERAARLVEGGGVHLQYRGAAALVMNWLESLPEMVLNARPSLWVTYASALNLTGYQTEAERKLQAAESALADKAALDGTEPDDKTQDIIGHIAAIRAMIAVGQHQLESIIAQSRRALEYLHPDNLPLRTITTWTLGYAYQLQGDRAAASLAYTEVISNSQASGDIISTLAATTGLGNIQESENQLYQAAESYRLGLQLFGDPPQPVACGTYLCLARILYEWNDLDAAQQHGQQSLKLAQQVEGIDTPALSWVLLARLKLAQGDATGAAALLAQAEQFVRQHNFLHRMPEVAAVQVLYLLQKGNLAAAADLAEKQELPISQTRVHLAQGDPSAALASLEPLRRQVEAKGFEDEKLKVLILQSVALHAEALQERSEKEAAVHLLGEALAIAEPGGFIRIFVDEGPSMARLLHESLHLADTLHHTDALSHGIAPDYIRRLLAAFPVTDSELIPPSQMRVPQSELVEPLSARELEVLQLIAEGLTNQEIGTRLYLSLHTVKVHAHNIYGKLGVKNRTQAVARGKTLGILSPP